MGLPAWVLGAVVLTLVKLWFTSGQPLYAIGGATHDDALFVRLADSILSGAWLGSYDCLTLAKGPFYSMWMAGVFFVGLPLTLVQQLVYVGACILLVRALLPLIPNDWLKLGIFALLLWNPMSFAGGELGRVLRQALTAPMALVLFAAAAALYVRRGEPGKRLLPWAAIFGFTWGGFWLTREDGVWILPGLAIVGGAYLVGAWRDSRGALLNIARVALVATVTAAIPILAVCALNRHYYGWFGTVEFRAAEFKEAYGALLRVTPARRIPFVPVTREMRERIYAVSPSFAELRPYLEGDTGRNWAANSSSLIHRPPQEREIGGGWFMWALRQTVAEAGHGHNAREALSFYAQIAREVNLACEDGRLSAGPKRTGFMPPWQPGNLSDLWDKSMRFSWAFATLDGFTGRTPPSYGNATQLDQFRDLTRMRLSRPADASGYEYALPHQKSLNAWKAGALQDLGEILRKLALALILAAQLTLLVRLARCVGDWRRSTFPLVLAAASWVGCASCLLVCALVDVTSFPAGSVVYFSPGYPLLFLFVVAIILDAVQVWNRSRRASAVKG